MLRRVFSLITLSPMNGEDGSQKKNSNTILKFWRKERNMEDTNNELNMMVCGRDGHRTWDFILYFIIHSSLDISFSFCRTDLPTINRHISRFHPSLLNLSKIQKKKKTKLNATFRPNNHRRLLGNNVPCPVLCSSCSL